MTKQQQKPSQGLLNKVKPKVTQLNKKMVISVVGIVLLVILLVMFNAFRAAGERADRVQTAAITSQAAVTKPSQNIASGLPAGYGDAAAIGRLLDRGQGGNLPAGVEHELSALRAQQAALEQQIGTLKAHSGTGSAQPVSPLDQEAATSAIFFAGGAPRTQSQQALQSQEAKGKASTNGTPSAKPSGYEQQNMQQQKLAFLSGKPDKNIYNDNGVQYPVSKYEVQAGTEIPAILDTQIDSDVPGVIVALVSQNVYDSISGQYLLIPKGSKLIGVYNSQVSYGQSILQAKFTRLIRPDGSSVVLPNQPAINDLGTSGMSDSVDNHWGLIIGSAVLSAVFNIPAIVATNQMNNNGVVTTSSGYPYYNPSLGSTVSTSALQGVGQSASQLGQQLTQKSLNLQPTIVIHAGYRFSIMVTKDIVLPPYQMPFEQIPDLAGE